MSSISNVLITGGSGFVGSWMKKTQPENMFVEYLGSWEYDNYLFASRSWDYIVHLAPIAPSFIITLTKRFNARLLYCSSGAVYHSEYQDKQYRDNKIKWEQECLDSGIDVVIARLFTFWGSSKAQTTLFEQARNGDYLDVWGDCTRSFMTGADLGRWMWAILLRGESGQAYDVGSDRPVTIQRLAERISAFTGCWIRTVPHDVPMPIYLPENTEKTKALL